MPACVACLCNKLHADQHTGCCCACCAPNTEATKYEVPLPQPATYQDWLTEFRDASKGAQPQLELTGAPTGWHPPASTTPRSHLPAAAHRSRWPSSSSGDGSGRTGQAKRLTMTRCIGLYTAQLPRVCCCWRVRQEIFDESQRNQPPVFALPARRLLVCWCVCRSLAGQQQGGAGCVISRRLDQQDLPGAWAALQRHSVPRCRQVGWVALCACAEPLGRARQHTAMHA